MTISQSAVSQSETRIFLNKKIIHIVVALPAACKGPPLDLQFSIKGVFSEKVCFPDPEGLDLVLDLDLDLVFDLERMEDLDFVSEFDRNFDPEGVLEVEGGQSKMSKIERYKTLKDFNRESGF